MVIVGLFITLAVSPTDPELTRPVYTPGLPVHFTLLTRRAILRLNMRNSMIVEPGDDARTAERVVALITKYAVRFDPVDASRSTRDRPRARSHSGRTASSRCAP